MYKIRSKDMYWAIFLISSVTFVLSVISLGLGLYGVYRDTSAWQVRAASAANATDMVTYLEQLRSGMVNWHMTSGNSGLVFTTAAGDMGMIYKSVVGQIDQAKSLEGMGPTPAYESGMGSLRDSIKTLDLQTSQHYSNHQGLWLIITFVITLIVAIIFGMLLI